jgi:uncharacterized surface protein with fasciclin (FAS1) repeats
MKNVRRTLAAAAVAAAVAATTLTGLSAAHAAPAAAKSAKLTTKPLAAVLAPYASSWDTNWNDYNIVTHAVFAVLKAKPKSAVGVLANGHVALTAFIPNDKAFQTLVEQISGKKLTSEAAVFAAVAKLGIPTVEAVLLYHVVPGATITSAVAVKANGAVLKSALGAPIRVAVKAGPRIILADRDPYITNPTVILSQVDINKGNKQIAHGIDRVLLPFQPKTA